MKAIVIERFGGPEVLVLTDREAPRPARGEVRVRVRATAVNRADLLQRIGAYPAPRGSPADIPGLEYAGTVEELGEETTSFQVGDRVFGIAGGGTYAESVVVHERTATKIPDGLSWEEAAALPEAAITAYDAIVDQGHLHAGDNLLVSAVGSGVGTIAVQLGRALGAHVLGTARTEAKLARASALGMNDGIVAKDAKFATEVLERTNGIGAHVVLELVGGDYVAEDLACIAPRGRIVVVGLTGGVTSAIPLAVLLSKRAAIHGTVLRARPLEEKILATQAFANHVVPLVRSGKIRPVVDRVFRLDEAANAHAYVASNTGFGKVVLTV